MSRLSRILTLGLALVPVITPALAASSDPIQIPKSRIERLQAPSDVKPEVQEQIDFGVSSWTPQGFTLPARVSSNVEFSRDSIPALYANYLREVSSRISAKAGIGWLSLQRRSEMGTQTAQLVSVRLGAEYSPEVAHFLGISPFFSAALLPSFALVGRSPYDDGSVFFGVPVEATLGVRVPTNALGIAWPGSEIDLGLNGVAGAVDHSRVTGIGIQGGVRVKL